ncbi:rare lipoprotein A [Chitinophaga eiseniae]|uniref:Probable endolytic peptidoglycan transglycosylase RlpA n=1 Tax=Chitinophaga eiseniae TaxID=634771 RepID=A0A1T4RJM0_9BACT|nr:septal ring lytic transglycosylase RlpA family protein [Chitinophaga eiseniae]SKA15861.1 rare lipoprotein A [Chitinophaga eiseniae]
MRLSLHPSLLLACATLIISTTACSRKVTQNGKASYYADSFDGKRTANGETFRQRHLTAAHRTLPFGTRVKVVNIANGRTVKVRINDRGPFAPGRIIDLSKKAASKLGMINTGVANVEIKYKKPKK